MGKVTLKQVASHAGVSYQTVSKVINQQIKVSKETEERIWRSIRALGYRPNYLARSLRSQRSRTIGYSWEPSPPDQVNPILEQFMQSMAESAEEAGYSLLVFPNRRGKQWVDAYRELINTNRVDGFILSSVEFNDPRIVLLQEWKFPFVAFGRSNAGWEFPYVDIDGGLGMRKVVEHLLDLGHRRIAALAWPEGSRVGENRMQGFSGALQEAGVFPPPEWIVRGEGIYTFGLQAAERWLNEPEDQRPTAIAAFNDAMAIGAMHAIQKIGLRVGADIAVTGFDDTPMVQYLSPSLTSVHQPIWEVGQLVMSLLLKILHGMPIQAAHILLPPELIVRESSRAMVRVV